MFCFLFSFLLNSGTSHPIIWKFLEKLAQEQQSTKHTVAALERGEELRAGNWKKQQAIDKRLKKMVSEYEQRTQHGFKNYLVGIAQNINFVM